MKGIKIQEPIYCLDIKKQIAQIRDEVNSAIREVIEQAAFSAGPFVENFEKQFAAFCHTEYAVGLNNGTSSLHLAMIAAGIKEGDEVIVPANTFIATAWAVSYVGAIPVFADCTADTWNINPLEAERKITSKTKAIIGVHLYGQPFDVDSLKTIAKKNNLILIEDAAQAHGAKYKGIPVGGLTKMGCFSFYPGKNLGGIGEGGAITTNSENYFSHIKRLQNHGSSKKYFHEELGFNMRMDGIQAAVLNVKLKYLDAWNHRRKQIAKMYFEAIKNSKIKTQSQPDWADGVFHLFVITTDDRDKLMSRFNEINIFPGMHYPIPCHLQKAYAHLNYKKGDCPNAEYLSEHCLSLPMYPELKEEEVQRIIEVLNSF